MNKNINIYKNQVYEILEFISKEEQQTFLDFVNDLKEEDWPIEVDNEFEKNDKQISGRVLPLGEKFKQERIEIEERILKIFKNSTRINNIAAIQRYKSNQGMGLHIDNVLDPTIQYGLIIYLNDDYEGGEIHYPKLELTIKPKARSVIIHPAEAEHEVLKVIGEKTRYIFSSFIRGDEKLEVFNVE